MQMAKRRNSAFHGKPCRQAGVAREAVQHAVRTACAVHAVAAILDGEASLAG
jgi:lipoyl-dependent peroxiredoxin subunit D